MNEDLVTGQRDALMETLVLRWHEHCSDGRTTLPEWLGWTVEQYKCWLETGKFPPSRGKPHPAEVSDLLGIGHRWIAGNPCES